jgi:enamine deaminase RidA (YjgF/YER057c/UK114 family)
MIKALSLAAALALLPLSAAMAQDERSPSEAALEAAAETFEARMEAFGERAEAIAGDQSLSEEVRDSRIAALWTEYQPDVAAFTATAARHAGAIAAEALADIDVDALVADALDQVDLNQVMAMAGGVARNGAWASGDPEQMTTYGLMADYVLGQALDAVDEATADEAGPAEPGAAD